MIKKIDLNKYADFVDGVTSQPSKDFDSFMRRVQALQDAGANIPRLLTAGIGLASEGGEFDEIVKKMIFQGKEYNAENIFHLKRELGDIIWYWIQACMALDIDPNEVIAENVHKLETRYPGGEFDPWYSENRKNGDL
jgi:NTP pyrophosphatase (non-canonical NTP hydrolase)